MDTIAETGSAGVEITATGDIPATKPGDQRVVALDILRGLAILMMIFASYLPFDKPLPRWLYHAQEPPTYDINHLIVHVSNENLPGITFVDLVFPLFLFSLGAAIPIALTKKLDRGEPVWKVLAGGLQRMVQLAWFGLYIAHVRPENLHIKPNLSTWLISLLGYALLYPMFTRLPKEWDKRRQLQVRSFGFGGGALLLIVLTAIGYYPHHSGFALWRNDVIIIVLANMAFFGTAIWVATRGKILWRLSFLVGFVTVLLGTSEPGWLQTVWNFTVPNTGWFFEWDYLKYLMIVIPGTIAGDLVYGWIGSGGDEPVTDRTDPRRLIGFILLTLILVAGTLAGLEGRKLWETALLCFACCGIACDFLRHPRNATETLVQNLMLWGCYWLITGILLQPFQGGIKKDPATLSYYFVTTGLAFFLFGSLIHLTTTFKLRKPFSLLDYSGQNPMIAYTSMDNFVLPILAITHLQIPIDRLFENRWMSVLLSGLETLLLAYSVSFLSKKKVFWRT